jgi:hypothetical protein
MTIKNLPLGNQSFSKIINQNFLYADKTKYVYELVKSPMRNFSLSRPRRFGKTLLLDTIQELFSGNRELFKDLWIGGSDYDFPKHPVIWLSLSMDSDTPELLKVALMAKLRNIAYWEGLEVPEAPFAIYFGSLIQALYKDNNDTEVVILIDEYDAPVTSEMADLSIAEANAKVLHRFFATLKEYGKYIHFTFVTGITRYALTSMDSGANHLIDISLMPKFDGLCGFTIEEFDRLFADRMESTLRDLVVTEQIASNANLDELRSLILSWYDGYSFDGINPKSQSRVLNPFSILNFFAQNSLDQYWIRSGRPAHLTAMIRANPHNFLEPNLDSYVSTDVSKSELNQLQAVPVLFHSGYLTLDKISMIATNNHNTNETNLQRYYSFRLPNFEVSSCYYADCFSVIFGLDSIDKLKTKGDELKGAFLARNESMVRDILSGCLRPVSYHQRDRNEKTFHSYIQLILSSMGFNVLSELSGADNRLDLCLILPDDAYLIIELKYRPIPPKKPPEVDSVLANLARMEIPIEVLSHELADAAMDDISDDLIFPILEGASGTEKERLLAELAIKTFTKGQVNKILSTLARKMLDPDVIEEVLRGSANELAQQALNDITQRGYRDLVKNKAKKIIALGLGIYGDGSLIEALFDSN